MNKIGVVKGDAIIFCVKKEYFDVRFERIKFDHETKCYIVSESGTKFLKKNVFNIRKIDGDPYDLSVDDVIKLYMGEIIPCED